MKNIFKETFEVINKKLKEAPKPEPQTAEAAAPVLARVTAGAFTPERLKKAIIEGNPAFISVAAGATPYKDLAFEDYNKVVNPLQQKLKDLEAKQREVRARWEETLKDDGKRHLSEPLAKNMVKIKELKEETDKQLRKAQIDYQPDLGLVYLAKELDTADAHLEGLKIMKQLYRKITALMPMINRAEICYYRGNAEMPYALIDVKATLKDLLVRARMNSGVSGLREVDKTKAEAEFNKALAAYKKRIAQKEESEQFAI